MLQRGWLVGSCLTLALILLYSGAPAQTTGTPPPPPAAAAYVDSAVCATCHAKEAETYKRTGMGRSFFKPAAANQIENYARGLPYFHEASGIYYGMSVRNGRYYQSQYELGFDGKQTNLIEKQIDYVVGSGNHTRTYLSRTSRNTLIELPLAWYAEKGGYWAMNPGYDRPDHEGYKRHIEYNCMFCHNAYPNMPAGPKTSGGEAVFPVALPEGIDCQRCHGPGGAHVRAAQNKETANLRATIVNPARIAPARQTEVCAQCHLETTSFPLPNSLTRYERGPFSYRPGEPLADFIINFDHAPGTGHEDDFEIASSAYQLDKSKCVLKSGARLTCTTCHNPHDVQHGAEAATHYNAICRDCHAAPLTQLISSGKHTDAANCIDCHMPKRRTDDVVHVVMTDHHIQRAKPARDLLADLPERHEDGAQAYHGEVVRYHPPAPAPGDKNDDELYVAAAQVVQGSNLKAGIPRLVAAIDKFKPAAPEHYIVLADAQRNEGQCRLAIPTYQVALKHGANVAQVQQKMALCYAATGEFANADTAITEALGKEPDDPKLWTQLGIALVGEGKQDEGIASLQKATVLDPDLAEAWNDLGGVWLQGGDLIRAEAPLRTAIRVLPNYVDAHNNLANMLSAANRFDEAKFHYEAALRYQPDSAFAHYSYGLALARAGHLPDAQTQLEKSLQEDNSPDTHHALGMILSAQGDAAKAIDQYREALRLRPGFPRASLSLGTALAQSGKVAEALPYLQAAAQSTDPAVKQEAQRLLTQYGKP